jgi:thiamine-monophosphate kinase
VIRSFSEDCAVVDAGDGRCQLLTVDVMVDGRHFRLAWMPAYYLGRKAVHVNVSDISAMGGRAAFFLVSLGLPPATPASFVDEMYRGIDSAAKESGLILAGGNVSASPVLFIDITMIGEVRSDRIVLRNGAHEGDAIFVTGPLGASAAGLRLLETGVTLETAPDGLSREAVRIHLDPPNLQKAALWLADSGCVTAMMDLSDGLSSDLPEICHESRVGARIDVRKLPVAAAAQASNDALELALRGGEDYHLLFTVARDRVNDFAAAAADAGHTFFQIGIITAESDGLHLCDETGNHPWTTGFEHFLKKS